MAHHSLQGVISARAINAPLLVIQSILQWGKTKAEAMSLDEKLFKEMRSTWVVCSSVRFGGEILIFMLNMCQQ